MKEFPKGIQFKYSWRKYQQIFLDQFSSYISDNHLHIVAPPGSGKTVLGLEIMLRINKPTLIIAPTLAIKNQWVQRFTELFLQIDFVPDYISTDIRNPKFITVTTYQGVHAACSGGKERLVEEEEESEVEVTEKKINRSAEQELIKKLTQQKIGTFILDEAHHLKKAWWSSLMDLKEALQPTIVALTATPPYDVSGFEWQKYIQLNGPVDAEISVPELMLEGNLCPHQDLVHLSLPSVDEGEKLEKIYKRAHDYYEEFCNDETILQALQSYDVYQNPSSCFEWIYNNISSYASGLVFLNYKNVQIDPVHFSVLGDTQKVIPEFSFFWLEELLDLLLFIDRTQFQSIEEHLQKWENKLRHGGFLENSSVHFLQNKTSDTILNSSIGKLKSIWEIVQLECDSLKRELRMVVLTDYIRKEFLDQHQEPTKIGAVPIFEILRRANNNQFLLGMLTGSLVILPKSLEFEIKNGDTVFDIEALPYDSRYFLVKLTDQNRSQIVQKITKLFEDGGLNVLVGTRSLLGEGWDAPKINSMILASTVGSFVSSNQMRGRAIRKDSGNKDKTSNIWHLATFNEYAEDGGNDWLMLQRRFRTFVGISNSEVPIIQNSMERISIPLTIETIEKIADINTTTKDWAINRTSIKQRWSKALDEGNTMVEKIFLPTDSQEEFRERKMLYAGKSTKYFAMIMLSTFFAFSGEMLSAWIKNFGNALLSHGLLVAGSVGVLIYGIRFFKAFQLYRRYIHIQSNIERIGIILLETLTFERIIRTPLESLKVVTSYSSDGILGCHLEGGNQYEKSQFISVLHEFVSPIDNPRYILQENFGLLITNFHYFPVPEILGKNKKTASFLAEKWNQQFGKTNLLFTRSPEGRKILLKLRFKNLLKSNIHIKHLHTWTR